MNSLRRLSLILAALACLLVPSLASGSGVHAPRCRAGYHRTVVLKHHKRRLACVRNRSKTPRPTKPTSTSAANPIASPPTTPTAPLTTPGNPPITSTTPATPPTPPATTPPPPPPPPFAAPDTAALRFKVDAQSNYDIAVQGQFCGDGFVSRSFPSVGNPAGTYVWTVDELWARPENSNVWHLDALWRLLLQRHVPAGVRLVRLQDRPGRWLGTGHHGCVDDQQRLVRHHRSVRVGQWHLVQLHPIPGLRVLADPVRRNDRSHTVRAVPRHGPTRCTAARCNR